MQDEIIKTKYNQYVRSNNYLKMHRIPMRRKMRGTRRKKRYFFMDEMSLLLSGPETGSFFHSLYKRGRIFYGNKKTTAVMQRSPLPTHGGDNNDR